MLHFLKKGRPSTAPASASFSTVVDFLCIDERVGGICKTNYKLTAPKCPPGHVRLKCEFFFFVCPSMPPEVSDVGLERS